MQPAEEAIGTKCIWMGVIENIEGVMPDNVFDLVIGDMFLLFTDEVLSPLSIHDTYP
ncbi:MAG: hypothetical protein KJ737_20325 [Proteobacteria bacterium]|nr:hypothetical protein [Pseudomonadota bacterium]